MNADPLEAGIPCGPEDFEQTSQALRAFECDALLIDSPALTTDYLRRAGHQGFMVICRDDLAECYAPCRLVINGNADALELPYRSGEDGHPSFLLGPRYAVLHPDFWEAAPRPAGSQVQNLLVVLGGANPSHLIPALLREIDGIAGEFTVSVVLGPLCESTEEIRSAAAKHGKKILLLENLDSLCGPIRNADLAVSAGGQTLYELARMGCPTVTIQAAPNQRGQMESLERAGCIRTAGEAGQPDLLDRVFRQVKELLDRPSDRAAMALSGRRTVDGLGAGRVARTVRTCFEGDPAHARS